MDYKDFAMDSQWCFVGVMLNQHARHKSPSPYVRQIHYLQRFIKAFKIIQLSLQSSKSWKNSDIENWQSLQNTLGYSSFSYTKIIICFPLIWSFIYFIYNYYFIYIFKRSNPGTITYSKSTIETLEKFEICSKSNNKETIYIFHSFYQRFYRWFWTGKFVLKKLG